MPADGAAEALSWALGPISKALVEAGVFQRRLFTLADISRHLMLQEKTVSALPKFVGPVTMLVL